MGKAVAIETTIRTDAGRKPARRCRREGRLPAVIYGHNKQNLSVAIPLYEFVQHVQHGVHLLELELADQENETVLIKDIQYNYLGTDPVHVDFTRVDLTERVKITVPVTLRGTPVGVNEGGMLQQVLNELEIECVVTDIPDQIKTRVNDLNIGDSVHARAVELPEGAVLVTDPDAVIANVSMVAEEAEPVEEEAAAETAEPEVITKGKAEEDQAEETK